MSDTTPFATAYPELDVLATGPLAATAAHIADATHAVNTANKKLGRTVWDTSNKRLMVANGALATDDWYVCDGSGTHVTPA